MWRPIRNGWTITWNQPFTVLTLFLYHLLWGLVIYKLVQSVAVPLLRRYPGAELPAEANRVFWAEGQFQFMKTDLIMPYVWTALALLVLRLLLSPMLNAGIYYSLLHPQLNAGYRFAAGIRRLTASYFVLYAIKLILAAIPFYWLVPYAVKQYNTHATLTDMGLGLLPGASLYLLYSFLLDIIFIYLYISKASERSLLYGILFLLRHLGKASFAALMIGLLAVVLSAAVTAASLVWAGLLALIGLQAYRLLSMFFSVWAISSQYALWSEQA